MLLYADENFPMPVVMVLRQLGHDVLTTLESGKAGQAIPDEDVLTFATENQRTLLTFNRKDFIQLHQKMPQHEGIIVCTVDNDFHGLAKRIDEALSDISDIKGQLIRVNRPPN
ncbi:MAG: DUF5615 family PIN-like protein [Anaerolineae bacterium]|nr:DUF5615 family PIN-like protein [Anaerolineae bacterium]